MDFSKQMDAINNSNFFNASGLASILSFFGLNAINIAQWADINVILLVCIGFFSLAFSIMKVYREYLETKRLKKQMKKEDKKEEDNDAW